MTETILMEPALTTLPIKKKQIQNHLETTILEAIDESLASFGESVQQVIYFQLQSNHNVKKQDIPSRIETFAATIEEIFGVGARLIEMKIMENLYAKTQGFLFVPKGQDLMFKDYMLTFRCFLASSVSN